jgi:hypothetical protein
LEALAKVLKARRKGHSGQAKRDPESSFFKMLWTPAPAPDPDPGFAGMTLQETFYETIKRT